MVRNRRARRVTLAKQDADVNEAIHNVAKYGIVAVRRRKFGEITQIKHISYGWMSAATYGQLRMLKNAEPMILEIVKGGYRLKAYIWATEIPLDVLASGAALPFGVFVVFVAVILYIADTQAGNSLMAALDLLALALPFGELYLIYHIVVLLWDGLKDIIGGLAGSDSVGTFTNLLWEVLTVGAPMPNTGEILNAVRGLGAWLLGL
jgi:hypothetical protein